MKIVLRLFAFLVVLAVLVVGAAVLFQDRLIAGAIEKGGTHGTGVETRIDGVDAGLFSGRLELDGLTLAEPPGFDAEKPFLQLGSGRAKWENRSLLGDRIEVEELVLDGIEIDLERNAQGSNWGVIVANLERLSKGGEREAEPAGGKKELAIRRLELLRIRASLRVSGLPVGDGVYAVDVPRVVLEDFESDGSTSEMIAKLFATVIDAILEATVAGGGNLPKELLRDLEKGLEGLGDDVRGEVRKQAEKALEGLDPELKKGAEGALDDLLKRTR